MIKKLSIKVLFLLFILILVLLIFSKTFKIEDNDNKQIELNINKQNIKVPLGTSYQDIKENLDVDTNDLYSDDYTFKDGEDVEISQKDTSKISINNASKEELMSLPGIGEKTAIKIIEYRQTSSFKSIEDLKKVKGIGDKKYEKIKDLIVI